MQPKPLDINVTCDHCGSLTGFHLMDTDWDPLPCSAKCGAMYGLAHAPRGGYKMVLLSSPSTVQHVVVDTRDNEVNRQARNTSWEYLKQLSDEARAEDG